MLIQCDVGGGHWSRGTRLLGSLLCFNISERGPLCNVAPALKTSDTHIHTPSALSPPHWRTLLTSWDIVILGREHNWVNMSVLCVLSDMTPGCSCGGGVHSLKGLYYNSTALVHCLLHYITCFMNILDKQGMRYLCTYMYTSKHVIIHAHVCVPFLFPSRQCQ